MKKGSRKRTGLSGALSDLYTPDAAGPAGDDDLGARLIKEGTVSSEMVSSAQRVVKQTPGKHLAEILIDMGADEADIQPVVAELARLPFERVLQTPVDHLSQGDHLAQLLLELRICLRMGVGRVRVTLGKGHAAPFGLKIDPPAAPMVRGLFCKPFCKPTGHHQTVLDVTGWEDGSKIQG